MLIVVFKEAYTKLHGTVFQNMYRANQILDRNNNPIAGDKVISEFLSKDISSVRRTERICNIKQHSAPFIAMRQFSHHILVKFFNSYRSSRISSIKVVKHHYLYRR